LEAARDANAIEAVAERAAATVATCRDGLARAFASGDLDEVQRLVTRLGYLTKLGEDVRRRRIALLGVG
jgi:hypothetical protein